MADKTALLCGWMDEYNRTAKAADKIEYLQNEPLANHTTFRIGGNADLFLRPLSVSAFQHALALISRAEIKMFILGRGSNVLFDDAGFRGAVVSTAGLCDISYDGEFLACGCGVQLSAAAVYARDHSLAGAEFFYGIPGSIGGAVRMNAGAYDGETAMILHSSTCLNLHSGEVFTLDAAAHNFSYRHSVFADHPEWMVLSASFALQAGDSSEIGAKMEDFMDRRRTKQPLEYPSAGSVFKRYPGYFTAKLIDEAGLKGTSVGGAQVSEKHAGFIINRGGATAEDVKKLIALIQEEIHHREGIHIECEIIHVGE